MALPTSLTEREMTKFVEDNAGNTAVRVVPTDASGADMLKVEDTAHTDGDSGTPIFGVRNDVLASLVDTDGDYAALQVNASGALYVQTSGTGTGQFAEDVAHNTGDIGTQILAVRNDAESSLVDTDGDYAPLQVDDIGLLKVIAPDISLDDDAAYTTASDTVVPMGGYYSSSDDEVDSGDAGILAMTINRHLKAQIDGYDAGTDSNKSFEVSPLSTHHVEETVADVTDETNATTNYFVDMDGYRNVGVHFETEPDTDTCTLTLQASNQDDGTSPASITDWIDVTTALTGSASFTADEFIIVDTPVPIKWIRIQTVTAGGNNTADYRIYSVKQY